MEPFPQLSPKDLKQRLRHLDCITETKCTKRRDGAVMVIFMDHAPGSAVLFTKRAAALSEHAGQISFPGGRVEKGDLSLRLAALRETYEEVGIEAGELEILSALPPQPVLDHWLIHPFTAWWSAPRRLIPDPAEVDRVIVTPLAELTIQHQRECWHIPDPERACRYQVSGELLWGATARIIGRLLDSLLRPPVSFPRLPQNPLLPEALS